MRWHCIFHTDMLIVVETFFRISRLSDVWCRVEWIVRALWLTSVNWKSVRNETKSKLQLLVSQLNIGFFKHKFLSTHFSSTISVSIRRWSDQCNWLPSQSSIHLEMSLFQLYKRSTNPVYRVELMFARFVNFYPFKFIWAQPQNNRREPLKTQTTMPIMTDGSTSCGKPLQTGK